MTVFGTRPQLVKLAPLWRRLEQSFISILVDSGQHYSSDLAGAIYAGEGIRPPDHYLAVRGEAPGQQIARVADRLDRLLVLQRPAAVITLGDTSTTAGAAIAAAYRNIPIAHVEAGLRSYDSDAPEEKNRLIADHLSAWRFCPTRDSVANLRREGISRGVFGVGDVMYEAFLTYQPLLPGANLTDKMGAVEHDFCFVTCHRAKNVDDPERLRQLVGVLQSLGRAAVFAVHPRARKNLVHRNLWKTLVKTPRLTLTTPLDHLTTLSLVARAHAVLTDSGGIQREAFWCRTPCLTLRDRTEWMETVRCGGNRLVDLDAGNVRRALSQPWRIRAPSDPCWRIRRASERIVARLVKDLA